MIHLGTQYYRPPFPNRRYWEEDIRRMADAGLNTIQLWVVWAWVEAKPGQFVFDDYDELVALADKHGLQVVLSTIAAIHPYWIHWVVPGSEMVDNFGHKVVSSNRGECHFGLTPGGCFDHPGVWERMRQFLETTARHYRTTPNLFGWDAWNELRWNVQADGLVCYCDYTLNRFRAWLDQKYGGLEGLNRAWERRYTSWEDVLPGKMPNRPYTEMMAFEEFISWRSVQHAYARYEVLRAVDEEHPITVHGAQPTVLHGYDSYPLATALHRGNDWAFADRIDGIGCSSFPLWGGSEMDRADFFARIDFVASARRDKRVWLSELQGGRSNIGFSVAQSVDPVSQQGWVWGGLGAGADTILFWCWRDEVFGRESTGFGLSGSDGLAEERLAAMKRTGQVLNRYGALLESYTPAPAQVGLLFSPQAYYLHWAQDGTARVPLRGVQGYARALVRHNIPYRVVEENHLDDLKDIKLLILPRAIVMDDSVAERLADFVEDGGVLFSESEVGAFGTNGIYRYPEDRYFAHLTGIREIGRRQCEQAVVTLSVDGRSYVVPCAQWLTPMVSPETDEPALMQQADFGSGRILFCGTYLGDAYLEASPAHAAGFERFLVDLTRQAGVVKPVEVVAPQPEGASFVHVKLGTAVEDVDGTRRPRPMAFVLAPDPAQEVTLRFVPGTFGDRVVDILNDRELPVRAQPEGQMVVVGPSVWGISVLMG